MKPTFGAAMMLFASVAASQAQDVSGVVSLGYGENRFLNPSVRVNENTIKGRVRAQMGNGLSFGLQAGDETTYSGATTSGALNAQNAGIDVSFASQNGGVFGAYVENYNFKDAGTSVVSSSAVGLTAGYISGGLSLKGFVGSSLIKDAPLIDVTILGGTLSYAFAENFTMGANISQHNINNFGAVTSVGTFGLGAVYHPIPALGIHGGFSSIDAGSNRDRLTEMGLGASYNVNMAGSPILTSIELVRNDLNSSIGSYSVNTIRIGITFPLGKAASKVSVPINSTADKVFQPVRNILGSSGKSLF